MTTRASICLSEEQREKLGEYVKRVGEPAAVADIGVSRGTLGRLLGGMSVKGATARLASMFLAAHDVRAEKIRRISR